MITDEKKRAQFPITKCTHKTSCLSSLLFRTLVENLNWVEWNLAKKSWYTNLSCYFFSSVHFLSTILRKNYHFCTIIHTNTCGFSSLKLWSFLGWACDHRITSLCSFKPNRSVAISTIVVTSVIRSTPNLFLWRSTSWRQCHEDDFSVGRMKMASGT